MKNICTLILAMSAFCTAAVAAPTQAREIVVAQVAAFTGPLGPRGKGIHAGVKLYFDKVNAGGGINGVKIRFISKDDGYKPLDTVRLVKETIAAERPVAFIGSVGTTNVEALMKERVLIDANVPLIGATSGASSLVGAPYVFTTKATYHDESDKLFSILTTTGVNSIGIVYQDDSFGVDVIAGLEKAAAKTGIRISFKAPFPRNTTDVKAAVGQVIKANPPLIYLAAPTSGAIEFIKEYRQGGGAAQIYGVSVIDGSAIAAKLGPVAARGFAFGTVVPPASARSFAIVREYQELAARSKDPDLGGQSLEGFISAKVLVHALRKAKKPTPAAVAQALAATSRLDLGDYMIDFSDKNHAGSRFVDFAILDGRGQIIR
jgi:ABC-type branched-subunit amino acid transport system substrate-binding protein